MAVRRTIIGSGASFAPNRIAILPPLLPRALSWCFFGSGANDNVNQVYGGPALTEMATGGSPTRSAAYVSCLSDATHVQGYDTAIPGNTAAFTAIVVLRKPATWAIMIGNYPGSSASHRVEVALNGNAVHVGGEQFVGSSDVTYASGDLAKWRILAVTWNAPAASALYDLTRQSTALWTGAGAAATSAVTLQLGAGSSLYAGGAPCNTDLAFFAAYGASLTQADLLSLLPSIRFSLAARGIVEGT